MREEQLKVKVIVAENQKIYERMKEVVFRVIREELAKVQGAAHE